MDALRKCIGIIWRGVLVTAFAAIALVWAVRPVFDPIGLGRYDTTALIRHTFPIRLVQPQWIADQSNLYFEWSVSEARARFLLIVVCWVAACLTSACVRLRRTATARP
jgi:hypothetical protein